MKLVIAEYLRTLRERDELDRLLPDLLIEMGYVPLARPQTGNRQFGVDLAARGANPESGAQELLLAVIKQGDIGRPQWNGGEQAVRQSIEDVFDSYLKSHVEPQDKMRHVRIVVVTNGELKQTVQQSWCGFVDGHKDRAVIDFWGLDTLAGLVERYLIDEHVFLDADRKDLRRALALSGDSDYDRRDLHRLYLRTLGLNEDGHLLDVGTERQFFKALRIINLSAHAFASWATSEGDTRQALKGMERAMLWAWHRIHLADEGMRKKALKTVFGTLWAGYLQTAKNYFERVQEHCYVEDSLAGFGFEGSELSFVAFELIGLLGTIGLSQVLVTRGADGHSVGTKNAEIIADALVSLVTKNGICNTPCLDRHSQDVCLAMSLLLLTGKADDAREWLKSLVRNVDYSFKRKCYIPVSSDSLDDLVEDGGWHGGQAAERLMDASWMVSTLAGWCAILDMAVQYEVLRRGVVESYQCLCPQMWHPDYDVYKFLYFQQAHYLCGASEAPLELPPEISGMRAHMRVILKSNQVEIAKASPAGESGIHVLDLIAGKHFETPLAPFFWFQWVDVLFPVQE